MKKILFIISLIILLIIIPAMPVLAIADPDSPPSINAVYVYEDLFEDDDIGILVEYYLDYAATPTEIATEAYLCSFIDTDGTTQLGTNAPFAYNEKGYEGGLVWIYFNAIEVDDYSIDYANMADYEVWFMGNPTVPSGWAGDPPKTIGNIDYWQTSGDSSTLLALRVLYYAEQFQWSWTDVTSDLLEQTPLGSRLTTIGEGYFENVIPYLRILAPDCFSVTTVQQTQEELDYTTEFGATMTNGTGTVTGSPITLAEGANDCDVTGVGTFTLELDSGTYGTAESDVGTVTGSPATLVPGTNTITVTVIGNIIVTVNLADTQAGITDTITGTGFDLSDLADEFGVSTAIAGGFVWMIITTVLCYATFTVHSKLRGSYLGSGGSAGKTVMIVFDLCIIGGAVLGLLELLIAVLLFIGFGIVTGYVLFYRHANF